ncbi:MAG: hypothetical protein MHM6MM_002255 [Cercozoa sp. M6MM]
MRHHFSLVSGCTKYVSCTSDFVSAMQILFNSEEDPQPGHVGNLTEVQQRKLGELREAAQKHVDEATPCGDRDLLRFLRARNFKVPAALEMLAATCDFRREHQLHETLEMPPPRGLDLLMPAWGHTYDKEGDSVWLEKFGELISNRTALALAPDFDCVHLWHQEHEMRRLRMAAECDGKPHSGMVYVGDMSGLSMSARKSLWIIKRVAALDEAYYPETAKKVFLTNAPRIFSVLFNLIKPFLNEVTRSKISVYSHGALNELDEYIGLDNVPVKFGGRRTTPDLYEVSTRLPAPLILPRDDVKDDTDSGDLKEGQMRGIPISLAAGAVHEEEFEVRQGEFATWYAHIVNKDVLLSIHFRANGVGENTTTLVPEYTLKEDVIELRRDFRVPADGTLVMRLDNSKSRWRGKNLLAAVLTRTEENEMRIDVSAPTTGVAATS